MDSGRQPHSPARPRPSGCGPGHGTPPEGPAGSARRDRRRTRPYRPARPLLGLRPSPAAGTARTSAEHSSAGHTPRRGTVPGSRPAAEPSGRCRYQPTLALDGLPDVARSAGHTFGTCPSYQRKWTKTRPKFLESFSTRWYRALISFCSRNLSTCFLSWPEPLPGMISTRGALVRTASSMIAAQSAVDVLAAVIDVVQVELEFHRASPGA